MSSEKLEVTVTRAQIMMALAVVKSLGKPGAFLLGKAEKHVTAFLERFPQATFRLSAEAISPPSDVAVVVEKVS